MMAIGSRKRLVIVVSIILIFLVVVGIRLVTSKAFRRANTHETPKIPVVVQPVTRGEIRRTLTFPGDLHAEREATVYSPVAARVVRYNYREGEEVSKGATLVVLEREERWNKYMPLLVEAPITGRVADIYTNAGEYATTETPLCLLIGGKTIRVVLSVPDPDLRAIRPSMEALLTVPTIEGRTFPGTVTHVTPFIKSETRTGSVEVVFENADSSLLPGMYGSVTIVIDRKDNVLVVPLEAVVREEGAEKKPYVFVVEGGRASKRYVALGILEEKSAEVTEGLTEGERVVTVGTENLSDNTPVVVVEDR
jgi:multidrug efflux pump subunit AcrA (membrane-fusion protein)